MEHLTPLNITYSLTHSFTYAVMSPFLNQQDEAEDEEGEMMILDHMKDSEVRGSSFAEARNVFSWF